MNISGEISAVQFTVAQTSNDVAITRPYMIGLTSDVNYVTTAPETTVDDGGDGTYDHLGSILSPYKAASLDFEDENGAAIANSYYIAENIIKGLGTVVGVEKKAANGEVSFVAVKLVYTPAAAEMSDGVAITAGTTFYRAKMLLVLTVISYFTH